MSRPPEMGNTGREMLDNTRAAAWADPENDYAWAKFLSALSHLLDPLADVTRPPDDSGRWTVLASPSRVPDAWLPVLAQWAGVRRPDSMSPEALRELIGPTAPGMWRGTKAAMIAAVRRFFPSGFEAERFLYFEERAVVTGDPNLDAYALRVFTYSFVDVDEEAVRDALAFAKPAGLYPFIYEVRVGQTWGMHKACGYTWWQTKAAFANWYEVLHQPPDECRPLIPHPEPPEPPNVYDELVIEHGAVVYLPLGDEPDGPVRNLVGPDAVFLGTVTQGDALAPGLGGQSTDYGSPGAGSVEMPVGIFPEGLFTGSLTAEVWMLVTGSFVVRPVFAMSPLGNFAFQWTWASANVVSVTWGGRSVNGSGAFGGVPMPATGEMTHLVMTFDLDTFAVRYYRDGVLASSGTIASAPTSNLTQSLLLAANSPAVGRVPGRFQAVALYDRALTAAEVAEHYAVGSGIEPPEPADEIASHYNTGMGT